MKAVLHHRYGSADVLELGEVDEPTPGPDQVLVRVKAAAVNPLDYHSMRGRPLFIRLMNGLRGPRQAVRGADASGVVEMVGSAVTDLRPGDEVFGARDGSFAELVAGKSFVPKPASLTFEQAAAIPVAAVTALQGLRDKGGVAAGQRVLVNGAAGGIGTFAVQIAKAYGAHVTGVCSTRNLDMVRALGADEVVDYTREDVRRSGARFDIVLDNVGNVSLLDRRRLLAPNGRLVIVGAMHGHMMRTMARGVLGFLVTRFGRRPAVFFVAKIRKDDLLVLKELVDAGKLRPVIDRTYPLSEAADAVRYVQTEHARGKVVVTVA
jgi:NADPH:quinone reductase-like Zn-dependent oxidoreductase